QLRAQPARDRQHQRVHRAPAEVDGRRQLGRKMDLLLIGGVSGSGKNVALAALEDSGYHAINNLPPSMLVPTIRDLARSGHERVAIALDVKSGPGLPDIGDAIRELRASGWTVRFLYLDAKTDTLVKRFSETRRRHPFSSDERTLTEAIEHERK